MTVRYYIVSDIPYSHLQFRSCSDTDNTAGRTSTCIAGLLALLVSTLAEVVGTSVYDNGTL